MITLTGHSDDLIELDGDLYEEWPYGAAESDDGDFVAFSDGTVLRIWYGDAGVWRITPVVRGMALVGIEQAPEDDEENYSDTATLTGALWAVHGVAITIERRTPAVVVES